MTFSRFTMMQPFTTILVCLLFVVFSACNVRSLDMNKSNHEVDELQTMKIVRQYLKKINKHAEKTITSPDGDLIDCVLFYKQPAFDNPLLKGKISKVQPKRSNGPNSTKTFQLWNANGEECPEGTIPIRRTTEEDVLRAPSLERFGKKPTPVTKKFFRRGYEVQPKRSHGPNSTKTFQLWNANSEECPEGTIPIRRTTEEDVLRAPSLERFEKKPTPAIKKFFRRGYELAIGIAGPGRYYGAKADLNVWDPYVENNMEYSSAQMWLVSNYNKVELTTVEVGWHIFPRLYKDNSTRFFIYSSGDLSRSTGCFNLLCKGFVQTSKNIAIGVALEPVSTYDGRPVDVMLEIEQDEVSGDWILYYGVKREEVGYWPWNLFRHLRDGATYSKFGGEVYNSAIDGVHTTTHMGSGHFPKEGYKRAAYVSNIKLSGDEYKPIPLAYLHTYVSNFNCYDVTMGSSKLRPDLGFHLFFGGPGRGFHCP